MALQLGSPAVHRRSPGILCDCVKLWTALVSEDHLLRNCMEVWVVVTDGLVGLTWLGLFILFPWMEGMLICVEFWPRISTLFSLHNKSKLTNCGRNKLFFRGVAMAGQPAGESGVSESSVWRDHHWTPMDHNSCPLLWWVSFGSIVCVYMCTCLCVHAHMEVNVRCLSYIADCCGILF